MVECPGQLWHLDMTSVWVACCTREIVGWSLELRCRAAEATAVIKQAVDEQAILPGTLTLGTDNGSAFTARATRFAISALGVTHRRGGYRDPESQAFIESWFRYLKERCVWRNEFETLDQAREVIAAYIDHYHDRPHSRLDYRTPREVRATWDDATGQLQKLAASTVNTERERSTTSAGDDLVRRRLDRFWRSVTASQTKDQRGLAAAHDLEHENDARAHVGFGDLADDVRVIRSREPPREARLLRGVGKRDRDELIRGGRDRGDRACRQMPDRRRVGASRGGDCEHDYGDQTGGEGEQSAYLLLGPNDEGHPVLLFSRGWRGWRIRARGRLTH
jgi:hypothetical protein